MAITTMEFIHKHLDRVMEIAGAYVACRVHEDDQAPDYEDRVREFMSLLPAMEFDQNDPIDVCAITSAKLLTSFLGTMRMTYGEEVDLVWQTFVALNALLRAGGNVE